MTGATAVTICRYNDSDTLLQSIKIARGGQLCANEPCWAAKGSKGFGYKDKSASADGITKIGYLSGAAGKGKADASGANNTAKGLNNLSLGIAAALSGNTNPTVQLITSNGLCIGATMTEVQKDEGGVYQARKK